MANASWLQQEEERGGRREEVGQLWPVDHDCVVAEQQQRRGKAVRVWGRYPL